MNKPSNPENYSIVLELPNSHPAILQMIDPDMLRWVCLCFFDALYVQRDELELRRVFPEEPDEFADLASELAELVVSGIAGDGSRAATAIGRMLTRHSPLRLNAKTRQVWLYIWAQTLRQRHVPPTALHPLWGWMAELTLRWLTPGSDTHVAVPMTLFR